jgi:hypothetical protein
MKTNRPTAILHPARVPIRHSVAATIRSMEMIHLMATIRSQANLKTPRPVFFLQHLLQVLESTVFQSY